MMTTLFDEAARLGLSEERVLRLYILEAVLRRMAASDVRNHFVLRGGMLTRVWVGAKARPTTDLDFLGDFAFDVEATSERFRAVLDVAIDDGISFGRYHAKGIWLQSEFPGVRLSFHAGGQSPSKLITVDVGFRDPLVPDAILIEYPALRLGQPFRVRSVRPETMLAWKLHGLTEMGVNWRPKDLADLWLISGTSLWDEANLFAALGPAFRSRGMIPQEALSCFNAAHWGTKTARVRWSDFRGDNDVAVPEALGEVLDDVRNRLPLERFTNL